MKSIDRYVVRCKNEQFLTYAVYDLLGRNWVSDTEETDLVVVNGYADDLNNEAAQFDTHLQETER